MCFIKLDILRIFDNILDINNKTIESIKNERFY